jgi:1-deoxy-D-xylulose-5-phosphate reductoisomerase
LPKENLETVTAAEALRHPNWLMGAKITIDSATMMNKGLEIIEAKWLFDISASEIAVLVHPQSVIHSMVEFDDGAIIAQLGAPDMRAPIQYALTYPKRLANLFPKLDFFQTSELTFEKPQEDKFPCLNLARSALEEGGLYPAVLNAANEIAVEAFLNGRISFTKIPILVDDAINQAAISLNEEICTLENILQADMWAREWVINLL